MNPRRISDLLVALTISALITKGAFQRFIFNPSTKFGEDAEVLGSSGHTKHE
jgi:hypothetical protein